MQLWYPQRERGFVQGITHSASRLGAAIAPPLVVLIMSYFGWRAVFYICGAVGFVWSLWWDLSYRNLPEEHGLVNRAELERIRGLDATGEIKPPADGEANQRAVGHAASLAQHVGDHVRLFHLRVLPVDLLDLAAVLSGRFSAFHAAQGRLFASLPLLAGVVGDTVGGLATDCL